MLIDEICAYLVSKGVGTIGTNIFKGSHAIIPAGDGPYLTVTETGGSGPGRVHNEQGAHTQRPTAQIEVRATSYLAARTMAKAAYLALDGTWNTMIGGVFYQSITARQEPTGIGDDQVGRPMIVFNVDAEKVPS